MGFDSTGCYAPLETGFMLASEFLLFISRLCRSKSYFSVENDPKWDFEAKIRKIDLLKIELNSQNADEEMQKKCYIWNTVGTFY